MPLVEVHARSFSLRYGYNQWLPAPCVLVYDCDDPDARAPGGRDKRVLCGPDARAPGRRVCAGHTAVLRAPDWAASTLA
jgi:hypothetical protein